MKKLHEEILINAPREKVWEIIIGKQTYPIWTKPFSEGSNFDGGWNQGDMIRFVGPEEDGTVSGMVSEISESRKPEFLSIKHIGIINHGVEKTSGPEVEKWAPAFENYTLLDVEGQTKFSVEMDIDEEYEKQFSQMWPEALKILKELSEKA